MSFITASEGDLDRQFIVEQELLDRVFNGRLWIWGRGDDGQRGDSTLNASAIYPVRADATFNASKITAGDYRSYWTYNPYFASFGPYATGINTSGCLGDGTTTRRSAFTNLGLPSSIVKMSAPKDATFFLSDTGAVYASGDNTAGRLGDSSTTNRSSPVTVVGSLYWKDVAGSYLATCGITVDGKMYTWGSATSGALGDSTGTSRSSPVTVSGGDTGDWKQVTSGYGHFLALKNDGSLYAWGLNDQGQLGDGTQTNRSSPVPIASGNYWKMISSNAGEYGYSSAGITTDGKMWTWGQGSSGQLGSGASTGRSSPVTVAGGGTSWSKVAMGGTHCMAVKTDGTLWGWGDNTYGQLGLNDTTTRLSPVQITYNGYNGLVWLDISAGTQHTVALSDYGNR